MRTRAWMLVFSSVEMTIVLAQCLLPAKYAHTGPGSVRPWPELRIAWKDPAAVLPGADRVSCSQRQTVLSVNACHKSECSDLPRHIGHTEPRQRQAQGGRKLTGQRLDLNADLWGEKPGGDLGGLVPPGPPIAP